MSSRIFRWLHSKKTYVISSKKKNFLLNISFFRMEPTILCNMKQKMRRHKTKLYTANGIIFIDIKVFAL